MGKGVKLNHFYITRCPRYSRFSMRKSPAGQLAILLELILAAGAFYNASAKESVFPFAKTRRLALVTDRRASGYQDPLKQDELRDYCSEIGLNSIVTSHTFDLNRHILEPFVAVCRDRIEEIYHNTEFHLDKVPPVSRPASHAMKTEDS